MAKEPQQPEPLHDPISPPLKDPPDKPMRDPPGDPTYEPDQPFGDPEPSPGRSDPEPPKPMANGATCSEMFRKPPASRGAFSLSGDGPFFWPEAMDGGSHSQERAPAPPPNLGRMPR